MKNSLLNEIIELTGLPQEALKKELSCLLQDRGLSEDSITLDHFRTILAEYLQDVLLEAKEEFK